ncbi:MAG: hypothetical protein SGPRY_014963 [Prymnesium sp.]
MPSSSSEVPNQGHKAPQHPISSIHHIPPLDPLADADALQLLAKCAAPKKEEELRREGEEELKKLLAKCNGLPAMLCMVGLMCRKTSVGEVLRFLEEHKLKPETMEAAEGYGNQFLMLQGQIDHLDQHTRRQCEMLAVLPEDASVPLLVLQLLWGLNQADTMACVSVLANKHLLELSKDGLFVLPLLDFTRHYLAARGKAQLHEWHNTLVLRWMEGCNTDVRRDALRGTGYWDKQLPYHLGFCSSLSIPRGALSIGERTFVGCQSLKSITLPDSVKFIHKASFKNCRNLSSLSMGEFVASIGDESFMNCCSLTSVVIPNGVETIGAGAFQGCTNLAWLKFGNRVRVIAAEAFEACTALREVAIPDSVEDILGGAFAGLSQSTMVSLPESYVSKVIPERFKTEELLRGYAFSGFGGTIDIISTVSAQAHVRAMR